MKRTLARRLSKKIGTDGSIDLEKLKQLREQRNQNGPQQSLSKKWTRPTEKLAFQQLAIRLVNGMPLNLTNILTGHNSVYSNKTSHNFSYLFDITKTG